MPSNNNGMWDGQGGNGSNQFTATSVNFTTAIDGSQHNVLALFSAMHAMREKYNRRTTTQKVNAAHCRATNFPAVPVKNGLYSYPMFDVGTVEFLTGGGIAAGFYECFILEVHKTTTAGVHSTPRKWLVPYVGLDPLNTTAIPAVVLV